MAWRRSSKSLSAEKEEVAEGAEAEAPKASNRFDLKKGQDASGPGFNQFDPVLSVTQFVSRRFGLVGGLAVVGLLAATEGREILLGLTDKGAAAGDGVEVTSPSGLKYTDLLVGAARGEVPLPGKIVGFEVKVLIGDKVLFDTATDGKPVAFKLGQRPFQNVVCAGLEEGLLGMRVGGRRLLVVPPTLAPPGVSLPADVALTYDVTLTEVLNNYF